MGLFGVFSFRLICLNDVRAVPLINKVVNTARSSFLTMCESKEYKSEHNSVGVWVLFVWCFLYFFPPKDGNNEKKLFELQELQLCWHFCSRNTQRSVPQEPSELANQISLDNLLQRSAALKAPSASLFGEAGCTRAGIWSSASHGEGVNLEFF